MKKEDFFEVLGELDDNIVKGAKTAMKKKSHWKVWGAMAACLCLIVVGAFAAPGLQGEPGAAGVQGVPGGAGAQGVPGGAQPGGTPSTEVIQPGNAPETTQPAKTNLLVVNEVENIMTSDMDVQLTSFDKLPYDVWMSVLEDFHKFVGVTYKEFTDKISDSFECNNFYSLSIPGYKDADLNDEYHLHDYVFEYQSENGGEVRIAICSSEEPLRDYFIMCDNPKQSEINGISVMIYGYQGTFMVEFSYKNINYDIETSNITLEELENLLTGIIS
ncbi:MAG: collagen-like protein [Acetatifactor sp.]|nr:collagen-like protein [Acetatifactor sp.]MDE7354298.1 collagen-like protein [Acetatifactor sp.]